MRVRSVLPAVAVLFCVSSLYAADEVILKTPKEKLSYIIGVQTANDLKRQSIDVDPAIVSKGLQDSMLGNKLLISDQEAKDFIAAYQKERAEEKKKLGEKNKQEGTIFLAENKKK